METDDVTEKASEIFKVCDLESKGFITRRDMQRLRGDSLIGLAPEHLDEVFDFLDRDRNGYLTMEELKQGFGKYLGMGGVAKEDQNANKTGDDIVDGGTLVDDEEEEERQFKAVLDNVGARGLFQNEDYVKSLWRHFRKDDVTLMQHFEAFLLKVVKELRKSQSECSSLESAFKNRSSMHDKEIRKMYEEMEQQMTADREKILNQERGRERRLREELEDELHQKEQEIQELQEKHVKMEKQLKTMNAEESQMKLENTKLVQERDLLEQRLECSERLLKETRCSMDSVRHKELGSRRDRAKAALRVSEGIALEREGLVKQLDILRNVNRKLVDEKDANLFPHTANEKSLSAELGGESFNGDGQATDDQRLHRSRFGKRSGSIMSSYFNANKTFLSSSVADECEVDDGFFVAPACPSPSRSSDFPETSCSEQEDTKRRSKPQFRTRRLANINRLRCSEQKIEELSSQDEDLCKAEETRQPVLKGEWKVKRRVYTDSDAETQDRWKVKLRLTPSFNSLILIPGKQVNQDVIESQSSDTTFSGNPERLYKIVFIGDSGVGKSSFIHRFCSDTFRTNFSATIGVDFQIRSVTIEGHVIALQLWDTAGQERFRSITKQYYRKADGVIIMYDVTSEVSFQNVRNWMMDVKAGADENTVLLLIGNKIDQCLEESRRVVRTLDGQRQAQDFGSLYHETSAKTGDGVEDAIFAMAALLQQREDEVIERALKLRDMKKKKKCC